MAYKTILVHADGALGLESRIRLAARLAHENHARLVGGVARLPAPLIDITARGMPLLSLGISDGVHTAGADCYQAQKTIFQSIAAEFDIETAWRTAVAPPSIALADMAAAADLIVCGRDDDNSRHMLALDDLVMRAGRPVLVTPSGRDRLKWGHVIVAWKNTREARRALIDALPLLARSTEVTLLYIQEADDASLADAVALLAHHGIAATSLVLPMEHRPVADQVLAFAQRTAGELIVLGAFGHSRAREWIFGGVTANFVRKCPIPCLFSQ